MSVTAEAPSRPPSQGRRWLAVGAAVLAAIVVVGVLYSLSERSPAPTAGPGPSTLNERLAAQIAQTLERSTPAQHQAHGHHEIASAPPADGKPDPVYCTAEVYGFEPASAASTEEVTKVYGYYLCAVQQENRPWDYAPKLVGPIVYEPRLDPPGVHVIEGGDGYQERLRALLPEEYRKRATVGFSDGRNINDVRTRYQAAS
ncbi:hypothetical protein Val02_31950 [Virgisporangium aliadipatigenens]|uniref:Uncharacterized protein n=1 Tax=Virgisporangium aliadipatigenens TaxID=741659 RepID=A0A8J3YJ79_9ACTN|nr:hypothetical protein [Virgisporangium aliadipatigenens]GIJ46309.1 hypothetical protein Val02_31950 [Virgisporangium aliadipatigenens]